MGKENIEEIHPNTDKDVENSNAKAVFMADILRRAEILKANNRRLDESQRITRAILDKEFVI